MTRAGERLLAGAQEALAVAKGEQPAARITIKGHSYVPESEIASLQERIRELEGALERGKSLVCTFLRYINPNDIPEDASMQWQQLEHWARSVRTSRENCNG